ncbi:AAA family ATPase [Mycolicibacterium setense]
MSTARAKQISTPQLTSGRPSTPQDQREQRDPAEFLDPLTLSRKEGWRAYVQDPRPEQPDRLSTRKIRNLSAEAADEYNERRSVWHANFGTIQTARVKEAARQIDLFVKSNQQRWGLKPALALTGLPGLGKTELVNSYAKQFHRQRISRYGEFTSSGSERWPACRIGMKGITGVKEFNWAFLNFYAHPGRGTADNFLAQAEDLVRECNTELLIVDDLHFLRGQYPKVTDLSNQFKYVADNLGVTIIFIGIGLDERAALIDDQGSYKSHEMDQLLRFTTKVNFSQYELKTIAGRKDWHQLLLTIEQLLVLANNRPGMLVGDLNSYLHDRSGGHIGSLMTLLRLGCQHAIDDGSERITKKLLDTFEIDSAAELGRRQLAMKRRRVKAS